MAMPYPQRMLPPPRDGSAAARSGAWPAPTTSPPERVDDLAPIGRPQPVVVHRVVLAALGMVAVVLSWQTSAAATAAVPASGTSLQLAALLIGSAYASAHLVFAVWTRRSRVLIDDLRWRSFRRSTWSGAWATSWTLTLVGAGAVAALLVVVDAHVSLFLLAGSALIAARVMTLKTLGTNMSRVVLGARRRLGFWGVAIAATDLAVIGVVVAAFVDVEPRRDALAVCAGWASFSVVVVGLFLLAYMNRVERWTLEWWDHRYGVEPSIASPRGASADLSTRRLAPAYLVGPLVLFSYWFVAVAALRAAITVWVLRDELTFSSDPAAAIDRIDRSIALCIVAVVVMQVVQGLWSVAQAWNARGRTPEAPSPWVMAMFFVAGPAVIVVGLVMDPDHALAFVALALLVNLGGWVCSFGALGRTVQILGRSAQPIAMWSLVVSAHWMLGFLARPIALLDDDAWSAASIITLSIVDAAVVVIASVHAWRAMSGMEAALLDDETLRRVEVGRADA